MICGCMCDHGVLKQLLEYKWSCLVVENNINSNQRPFCPSERKKKVYY